MTWTPLPEPWGNEDRSLSPHSGAIVAPFLVEKVHDNDIVGSKDISVPAAWSMFYSGKIKGPWVQLDLGADKTISAIEIYGHRAEPRCDLNLLESFSEGCDGSVQELGNDHYPMFSVEEYANKNNNNGGAVIGVGPPGEIGPCTDGGTRVGTAVVSSARPSPRCWTWDSPTSERVASKSHQTRPSK